MSKKPLKLNRKQGLYLKDTGAKGRGVFCDSDIAKGAVLEVSPGLILNEEDSAHANKTRLENYTFVVGSLPKAVREKKKIKNHNDATCVLMGLTSYCNHSEHPNAEVSWEVKEGTVYYSLTAIRRIPKHTEICTSYGAGWFDDRK